MLLNTIVAYLVLNLALGGVFFLRDQVREDPTWHRPLDELRGVYEGLEVSEIETILSENYHRPYIYSEFTHFSERPVDGRYVRVSAAGYRHSKNQGAWPLDVDNINIFVFGGSTTFGYGLPDEQTLPSHLQDRFSRQSARPVRVYNFGVGWYYSTQERLQLEKLLFQGHVPDIAIFVDGLNDLSQGQNNEPAFNDQFAKTFERVQGFGVQSPFSIFESSRASSWYAALVKETAVERAVISLRQRLARTRPSEQASLAKPRFAAAGKCYLNNISLIALTCRHFDVEPLFVWQPVPGYKYDLRYHLFANPDSHQDQREFYAWMAARLKAEPQGDRFLWCADIQEDATECLYLDSQHYTAAFASTFADTIVEMCRARGLFAETMGQEVQTR